MQLALQRGHAEAGDSIDNIDRYADMLLASRDPDERQQGYRIAQAAAEAGDINAMLWLAFRHERGDGVEISQDRASHWYGKAAAAGDAVAAERLARLDPH
jgi:TPR repeat protein